MAFDGREAEAVTLEEASAWTAAYRAQMGSGDLKGHFFGKDVLNSILSQTGCMGIRIYNGIDGGTPVLVCVGADNKEDDMTLGVIAERAFGCPPRCGKANSLNS